MNANELVLAENLHDSYGEHVSDPADVMERWEEYISRGAVTEVIDEPAPLSHTKRMAIDAIENAGPVALVKIVGILAEEKGSLLDGVLAYYSERIENATVDEIDTIAAEAKARGSEVWELIRPLVMRRNDRIAQQIQEYTNVYALEEMLNQLNTWNYIPSPIYEALKVKLPELVGVAKDMKAFDKCVELIAKCRVWRVSLSAINKTRDRLQSRPKPVVSEIVKVIKGGVTVVTNSEELSGFLDAGFSIKES